MTYLIEQIQRELRTRGYSTGVIEFTTNSKLRYMSRPELQAELKRCQKVNQGRI